MTETAIDPARFRAAVGQFATGVVVIAVADGDGRPHGMTANAFLSVSLDPPMILVSVAQPATLCRLLASSGLFSVSLLPEHAEVEARRFAGMPTQELDPPHFITRRGVPILSDVLSWIVADVTQTVPAGDHTLFLAKVIDLDIEHAMARPLLYHRSGFAALGERRGPPLRIDSWDGHLGGWG